MSGDAVAVPGGVLPGGFTVYPAVDIRGGRCVRLVRGDPRAETVFDDDPVAAARRWVAEGARALHVVDLDGAFAGAPRSLGILAAIAAGCPVPVQFGGGLRRAEDLEAAFAAGAARVIVGTRALDGAFLAEARARWGQRVVVGLDARGDAVAVEGWAREAGLRLGEAAARLRAAGVDEVVFTQVARDGTLGGPDLASVRRLLDAGLRVVASGGIGSAEDVRRLAALAPRGVAGVILGRALYDGRLTLADALAAGGAAGSGAGGAAGGGLG